MTKRLSMPSLGPALVVVAVALALGAPAALAVSFDPARMPTLRQGSRGPAVVTLQGTLNGWRAGRGLGAIAADGDFGPQTRTAVVTFQYRMALYPDGVVGPLTWQALAAVAGGASAPGTGSGPGTLAGWSQGAAAARQAAFWAQAGMGGRYAVLDLTSNGGRPVAVFLPQGFDPARPAKLLTYLHGHGGSIGEGFSRSGLFARIRDLATRHPQTVFVFPQAREAPFSYWMKPPEDFILLESQALRIARDLLGGRYPAAITTRIVSAHSGGGLALKNMAIDNALRVDHVELLDAAYGDWAQVIAAWTAASSGPRPRLIEAWHTPGSTETNDLDIARRYPAFVTVHRSAVAHGAVPTRYLGTALDH